MVQGKINRGRHTGHPPGRHSIRTNHCVPPPSSPIFFTDQMPFLPPNQQHQSTENTGRKNRHLGTIAQLCWAISSQLRHVSTIRIKNLLNSNISPTCHHNMVHFSPLASEICSCASILCNSVWLPICLRSVTEVVFPVKVSELQLFSFLPL